jgi:hypothetical protein
MSSSEGSPQTPQSRDKPTASATMASSANPPRRERSNTVYQFPAWVRLAAGVILVVLVLLVLAGVFFLGGWYYGGGSEEREDILVPVPEAPCTVYSCHPRGRGGQQCYYQPVPCS